MKESRRGYNPGDIQEFGLRDRFKMNKAAEEIYYLLGRGYDMKSCSTFVGNHHLLSVRQRSALERIISPEGPIAKRLEKEIACNAPMDTVHIDGFNIIITLEVAFSESLLLKGMDNTLRDLAGLRGTYRIIDKTEKAVHSILGALDSLGVKKTVLYLDKPVSNSGRLMQYIYEIAEEYDTRVEVEVINNVDRTLYNLGCVISTDAVILDRCRSWYNLNRYIIEEKLPNAWIYDPFAL